jgi:hypothetical protein
MTNWPENTLGIYLITRDKEVDYDEARGFVVAAIDEETARKMIADSDRLGYEGQGPWLDSRCSTALMLGRSLPGDEPRIILRDFLYG